MAKQKPVDLDACTEEELIAMLDAIDRERLEERQRIKDKATPVREALHRCLARKELAIRTRHVDQSRLETLRARAGVAEVKGTASGTK